MLGRRWRLCYCKLLGLSSCSNQCRGCDAPGPASIELLLTRISDSKNQMCNVGQRKDDMAEYRIGEPDTAVLKQNTYVYCTRTVNSTCTRVGSFSNKKLYVCLANHAAFFLFLPYSHIYYRDRWQVLLVFPGFTLYKCLLEQPPP